MPRHTQDILTFHPVTGTCDSPAGADIFTVEDLPSLGKEEKAKLYTLVYKMMHLTHRTRPDIMVPVAHLTTRVQVSTAADMRKCERVLKFLAGTIDDGITLTCDSNMPPIVQAYVDSSYAVHEDARSQTGCYLTLGKGPVYVSSTKQRINTKSSTESELVALSDKASMIIWTRSIVEWLLSDQTVPPARVLEDNEATIRLIELGRPASERTRHINIRHFFMSDRVKSGEIVLVHCQTENMIADVLTKPINGALYRRLRALLLNLPAC
jgi:hypothetical protein